jgi:DNA-binding IclR family transcriptional regulator
MSADEGFHPVKSAGRALDVLETLAATPHALALGDLARALGIPKSSLHGILRTMVGRGWVRTDPTGTRFRLGLRALTVGASYLDGDDAVGLATAALDQLSGELGETVHLGRLDGPQIIYLAKRESVHPLRLYSAVGRRLPAHATALGKALLAALPPEAVDARLDRPLARLTPATITDRAELHAALAEVRRLGYAVDREENSEGIVCFAMVVPLAAPATDAVSVSIPIARLRADTEERVVDALRRSLGELGAARGLVASS